MQQKNFDVSPNKRMIMMLRTVLQKSLKYLLVTQVALFILFMINLHITPSLNLKRGMFGRTGHMKRIIFWTKLRGFRNYSFGFGHQPFLQANCPVHQCETTADRSRAAIKQADAVVFHVPDFARRPYDVPLVRLPHQHYVFFVRESPVNSMLDMRDFNNFFNITMTYSADADVHAPYGLIEKRKHKYTPYTEEHFSNKTKFAVAIISHCHTQSERSKVISILQKHMPIDVLGNCGKKKLNESVAECAKSYNDTCIRELMSEYKFYLSFENSLCKDYITEKFFKVLDLPVIPVVYGAGNYSIHMPRNSFVDVHNFTTAKSLADYLKTVAGSSEKFLSYFKWRQDYEQVSEIKLLRTPVGYHDFLKLEPQALCNLCQYLHDKSHQNKVITDLPAFWGMGKNCFSPLSWLENFRQSSDAKTGKIRKKK